MNFNNDIAWNYDTKRRDFLKRTKLFDGKVVTYEAYIKKYLKSMSFMYGEVKADSKRYQRIMTLIEGMAKEQWNLLPTLGREGQNEL